MSHGDHWAAVLDDLREDFAEVLPRLVEQGEAFAGLNPSEVSTSPRPTAAYCLTLFDTPLRYMAVCTAEPKGSGAELLVQSAYPLCYDGSVAELTLDTVSRQHHDLEGVLSACTENGALFWFFDPFFFRTGHFYQIGERYAFTLAALALDIRRGAEYIEVDGGGLLEMARQRALEEDPDCDPTAIRSTRLYVDGASIWVPQETRADWSSFRSPVTSVERFLVDGREFYKLGLVMLDDEDERIEVSMYTRASRLGSYVPKVGDDVEGLAWVQGTCRRLVGRGDASEL